MDKIKSIEKTLSCSTLVVGGALILAFGFYNFNWQNNIAEGGFFGLFLLLENLFQISPSLSNIVCDCLAFAVGTKYFGKKFLFYSILCTGSFSGFYWLFEQFDPLVPALSGVMMPLGSIAAGLCVGLGVGLVVKGGGAAGGDDVIAIIISKFTKVKLSQVYFLSDVVILALSLVYLNTTEIFYSLIAVYISSKVISFMYYHTKNTLNEATL